MWRGRRLEGERGRRGHRDERRGHERKGEDEDREDAEGLAGRPELREVIEGGRMPDPEEEDDESEEEPGRIPE